MRESIFNILENKLAGGFAGRSVADIFAGTGAMGLEAISRGAANALFIEKHGLELLRENIDLLDASDIAKVMAADARNLPDVDEPFDVIFMDPPYGRSLGEPSLISAFEKGWIHAETLIVIEMAKDDVFDCPDEFLIIDERFAGVTKVLYIILNI